MSKWEPAQCTGCKAHSDQQHLFEHKEGKFLNWMQPWSWHWPLTGSILNVNIAWSVLQEPQGTPSSFLLSGSRDPYGSLSTRANDWLLSYTPSPVIRKYIPTLPPSSSTSKLRILQLKEYRWFKLPTNNLSSDIQILIQKHKKHEKRNITPTKNTNYYKKELLYANKNENKSQLLHNNGL
jgi:hypothetical protein